VSPQSREFTRLKREYPGWGAPKIREKLRQQFTGPHLPDDRTRQHPFQIEPITPVQFLLHAASVRIPGIKGHVAPFGRIDGVALSNPRRRDPRCQALPSEPAMSPVAKTPCRCNRWPCLRQILACRRTGHCSSESWAHPWAHHDFTHINNWPIILKQKIEEQRELCAVLWH
jgi:hypothetical protein